jgi:FtsP/CotA-like multicopper oxidase with cupredoxin domain
MNRNSLRTSCRLLANGFCLLVMTAAVRAQTVRPLINELSNPAKGRVEYVNDSLTPLNVVLEPKSFTVSETGEITYRPLDANVHLKLSTTSFRIQPQQTYYVFYEASSPQSPAWFVIYAAFSGFPFRTAQGMNVRLELPHTVYLLPKQSVEKPEVHIERAELSPAGNKVLLEVANTGNNFGRVLQTQLVYSRKKQQEAPGFPIFPHSKRILEVPLEEKAEGENAPTEVTLQFQNFKVEEKLQRRSTSEAPAVVSDLSSTAASTGKNP